MGLWCRNLTKGLLATVSTSLRGRGIKGVLIHLDCFIILALINNCLLACYLLLIKIHFDWASENRKSLKTLLLRPLDLNSDILLS